METTWCLGCTPANGHGQSCASLPHELGRCEAAPIQELYSCIPPAPLLIRLAMLSSIWPVQRAAHACSNRHILAFASSGAWSTALAALDQGRHIHSRAQCKPGKQISPPSPPPPVFKLLWRTWQWIKLTVLQKCTERLFNLTEVYKYFWKTKRHETGPGFLLPNAQMMPWTWKQEASWLLHGKAAKFWKGSINLKPTIFPLSFLLTSEVVSSGKF